MNLMKPPFPADGIARKEAVVRFKNGISRFPDDDGLMTLQPSTYLDARPR